jgi:drug/metabolite transporter (DMT)-like permease
VAYRFLIASAVLGLFLWLKRVPIGPSLRKGAILGFMLWALYVSQTIGLKYTTASNSGFITGLFVVFVPLLSFLLFRKSPDARRVGAVGVALVGLILLTGGLKTFNVGDALTLLAAVTYALHILYADRWVQGAGNPYALSFVQFATVGVLSLVWVAFAGSSWIVERPAVWWLIVFLALFPTLSAFVIQLVAQRITTPVKVALIFSMEPVFAALTAWTIGGERLVPLHALGGLLIVGALVLSSLPGRRRAG